MWTVVAKWSDPDFGTAVYGPYLSKDAAEVDCNRIKRLFVTPISSEEEYERVQAAHGPDSPEYLTSKQCGNVDLGWGGIISDSAEFYILEMNVTIQ